MAQAAACNRTICHVGPTTDRERVSVSTDDAARADVRGLVTQAAAGDREAMERLLMRAQEVAYRFSLLVCGHPEDAEDVMQDALLKTYRHVARIEQPEAFRTWLYTTVRNACLMKRRRRVGEPAQFVSLEQGVEATDGTTMRRWMWLMTHASGRSAADRRLDGRPACATALKKLPPSYRMIVVMREMEGLSTTRGRDHHRALGGQRENAPPPRAAHAARHLEDA